MSENAPKTHETGVNPENHHNHHNHPKHEARHEKATEHHERSKDHASEPDLETIRRQVREKAISSDEVRVDTSAEARPAQQAFVNKELKDLMFSRTLSRIQKQLPRRDRVLSKVVHAKPVDTVSRVGEKTIARPLGILGGGLLALLGSIFSTYLSRQFGLNYNLLVFALLFAAGYIITTVLELGFKLLTKSR